VSHGRMPPFSPLYFLVSNESSTRVPAIARSLDTTGFIIHESIVQNLEYTRMLLLTKLLTKESKKHSFHQRL